MQRYILLAVAIHFLVDFMLLFGAKQRFSPYSGMVRPFLGAVLGAVYAAGCLLSPLSFLKENIWYIGSILLSCLIVFGFEELSGAAVFCVLRLALDGLAAKGGYGMALILGLGLTGLFLLGFCGNRFGKRYIPVELRWGENTVQCKALWDTGHNLQDPITGKSILVVGADVACALTGLQPEQLCRPVETMGEIPGLRLIPYHTVTQKGQLMLGMMVSYSKIGRRKGACLVAFAPQVLDSSGKFQALIGGTV